MIYSGLPTWKFSEHVPLSFYEDFIFCSLVIHSCPGLCDPMDTRLLCPGFSMQEHWSGLPFPPPEDLPNPGIECISCVSRIAGGFFTTAPPGKTSLHSLN